MQCFGYLCKILDSFSYAWLRTMTSSLRSRESNIRASSGDQLTETNISSESHIHTHLRSRFYRDVYHTHISDHVLLALNPYTFLTCLDVEEVEQAAEALMRSKQSYTESQPHVSTLAAFVRARMRWSGENQHIVVHGENGAGKTHAIDSMLRQLLLGDPQISLTTRRKVFSARVVLDAFGGVRDSCNPTSSSRYVSCIKLNYTQQRVDQDLSAGGISSAAAAAASHVFYDWSEQPQRPVAASIRLHSVSFSRLIHVSDSRATDARGRLYGSNYPVFRRLIDACRGVMVEQTVSSSSAAVAPSSHNDNDRDHFNRTMKQVLRTSATLLGLSSSSDR